MARSDPRKLRTPKLSGAIIVDSYRGQARVRSWPKKTGRPKSPAVRQQNDWIRATTQIWKAIPASQQKAAREQTKGTGLYPRDIFTMAMSGGLMDLLDEDGTLIRFRRQFVRRVMFQGCILALDADFTVQTGAIRYPSWPLPLLDTAGFYDPTEPTLMTIPPGVAVVEFTWSYLENFSPNGYLLSVLNKVGDGHMSQATTQISAGMAISASTGPLLVSEGEQYRAGYLRSVQGRTLGTIATHFSVKILGTDF